MPSGGKKHVELQQKGLCSPPHLSLRRVGGIWSRKISLGGGLSGYPLMAGIGVVHSSLYTALRGRWIRKEQ